MKKITDAEFKKKLTPEEYYVLREKGTERPFSGKHYEEKRSGMYHCRACGKELFSSETKYDSRSGWPSFYDPVSHDHVEMVEDTSHDMERTEIACMDCGSHLGHMFPDGPHPTGKRYCVNSVSLTFKPKE